MRLRTHKVRYRGTGVGMCSLSEPSIQCLCTSVQQTHPGVDYHCEPTCKTLHSQGRLWTRASVGTRDNAHLTRSQELHLRKPESTQLQTWPGDTSMNRWCGSKCFYGSGMDVSRILAMLCCFWETVPFLSWMSMCTELGPRPDTYGH